MKLHQGLAYNYGKQEKKNIYSIYTRTIREVNFSVDTDLMERAVIYGILKMNLLI